MAEGKFFLPTQEFKLNANQEYEMAGFGMVTTSGTDVVFFVPIPTSRMTQDVINTSKVSVVKSAIRATNGTYIGGSLNTNITSYLNEILLKTLGQGLQIRFSKSGGWGITNNTPVVGTISITFNEDIIIN